MLLTRLGPRYLFIRTEHTDEVIRFLEEKLDGETTDVWKAIEKASDNSTICFITGVNHRKTRVEDAKKIVLVNEASTIILGSIINNQKSYLINRVDLGPASVVMRIAGNGEKLIEKLKDMLSAKEVELIEGIGLGEKDDTIISFTDKAINGPVPPDDFLKTTLLIPQPIREVQHILRTEALRLITQALEDSQWYELRINIYDSSGRYEENYKRLMFVLSKLEIGMILGESWTKDHAVMLFSVLTYQLRLFTFYTPNEIKKILMALEFTTDGNRLVDYDLYYKNKKVHWHESTKLKDKKITKVELALKYRKDLYEKLKAEDIETLENMERNLIK